MASLIALAYFILLIGIPQTVAMMRNRIGEYGFIIDTFCEGPFNDIGAWHGPGENLPIEYEEDDDDDCFVRLFPSNPDHNYHTQFSYSCLDLSDHGDMYLHVEYSGSDAFTISIFQHNGDCSPRRAPYPGTSDSVEAARYSTSDNDIYIPISHFYVDLDIVSSIGFHGFHTTDETILRKVEIVENLPDDVDIPRKLPTGTLVMNCKRPNSFAFGIDDGDPRLAQDVMQILDDEDIQVTFFVVGKGLLDPYTNFTNVYTEMLERGHQVALHSYTHPKQVEPLCVLRFTECFELIFVVI
jgi:Polysaccharide deacetylase